MSSSFLPSGSSEVGTKVLYIVNVHVCHVRLSRRLLGVRRQLASLFSMFGGTTLGTYLSRTIYT